MLLNPAELDLDVTNWARERDGARTKAIIKQFRKRFHTAGKYDVQPLKTRIVTVDGKAIRKVVDGRLRAIAAREEGLMVLVEDVQISEDEALDFGIASNLGHSLKNKEKERAVLLRLQHPNGLWRGRTPRWLGDDLGISAHTVKAIAQRNAVQFAQTLKTRDGKTVECKVALAEADEPVAEGSEQSGAPRSVWTELKWTPIPAEHNYVQASVASKKDGSHVLTFELDILPISANIIAKEGTWRPTGEMTVSLKGKGQAKKLVVEVVADRITPPPNDTPGGGKDPVASAEPAGSVPGTPPACEVATEAATQGTAATRSVDSDPFDAVGLTDTEQAVARSAGESVVGESARVAAPRTPVTVPGSSLPSVTIRVERQALDVALKSIEPALKKDDSRWDRLCVLRRSLTDPTRLDLLAFGGRLAAGASCPAEGLDGLAPFAVSGSEVRRFLAMAQKGESLTVVRDGDSVAITTSSGASTVLRAVDARPSRDGNAFPYWDFLWPTTKLTATVAADRLHDALRVAKVFTADAGTKPEGLLVSEVRDGAIWSTSKNTVSVISMPGLEASSLRVHCDDVSAIAKFLKQAKSEQIDVQEHERAAFFVRPDGSYISETRFHEAFPPIHALPMSDDYIWDVRVADMEKAVQSLKAGASPGDARLWVVPPKDARLELRMEAAGGAVAVQAVDLLAMTASESAKELPEAIEVAINDLQRLLSTADGPIIKLGATRHKTSGYFRTVSLRRKDPTSVADTYRAFVVWTKPSGGSEGKELVGLDAAAEAGTAKVDSPGAGAVSEVNAAQPPLDVAEGPDTNAAPQVVNALSLVPEAFSCGNCGSGAADVQHEYAREWNGWATAPCLCGKGHIEAMRRGYTRWEMRSRTGGLDATGRVSWTDDSVNYSDRLDGDETTDANTCFDETAGRTDVAIEESYLGEYTGPSGWTFRCRACGTVTERTLP